MFAGADWMSAVVESTEDAIICKTLDGIIRWWSPGAERIFGHTSEEAIGRSITLIIPDEFLSEERVIIDRLSRGERISCYQTIRRRKDGRRIDVSLSVSPIRDAAGNVVGAAKIARDVTSQNAALSALRESEERLRAALTASRTGTFRWDHGQDAFFCDDNVGGLLGLKEGDAIRTLDGFLATVHPHDRRALIAAWEASVRGGDDLRIDFRAIWPSGEVRWLHASALAVRGESGALLYLTGAFTEITRRKRVEESLRESESRFRTLADNIAQLAWMADSDGWIFWYNRRWFDYTGTTLPDMEGWGWQNVHHPEHCERVTEKFRACVEAGTVWEDTFPLRGADGEYRWFLSRAFPIRDDDGNVLRWFGTNTDITDRMEMEEALRQADSRKNEFLATLAHELRNPLAPIRTGLELIAVKEGDTEVACEVRAMMERQVNQLVRLVDDLLNVSRITLGKIELRRSSVALQEVLESACQAVQPAIDEAGHHLTITGLDRDLRVCADPARLAQVFSNLLDNAAKYTPRGGNLEVEIRRDGEVAVVLFRDNGIGIPEEMLESVFEMFTQVRNAASAAAGLGIGLTLVRRLVEMHGGSITARRLDADGGTEFEVRIPAAGPDERAEKPPDDGDSDLASVPPVRDAPPALRILVADDNRDAAENLARLLSSMGHDVAVAYDGEEAVAKARDFAPDVAFLDLGMPKLSGLDAARRIHDDCAAGKTPPPVLAAVTGWGQDDHRRQTAEAGFAAHLVKPVTAAVLREFLDSRNVKKPGS